MTEAQIRQKAKDILTLGGYVFWFPPRVKFYQNDIFGCFDLVAARGSRVLFIQLTTLTNLSHRRRKIEEFLHYSGLYIDSNCFVWAFDEERGEFLIEEILRRGI